MAYTTRMEKGISMIRVAGLRKAENEVSGLYPGFAHQAVEREKQSFPGHKEHLSDGGSDKNSYIREELIDP